MSQRPHRKKETTISLDDFEFNPSELDLKFSKNLISVLDGYRIHRTYDLGFIDKKINEGELPRSFIKQWGVIRKVLHKLAAIGPKVPGVERWLNIKQTISFSPTLSLIRPSCGSLLSAMFSFAIIFILDTIAAWSFLGADSTS